MQEKDVTRLIDSLSKSSDRSTRILDRMEKRQLKFTVAVNHEHHNMVDTMKNINESIKDTIKESYKRSDKESARKTKIIMALIGVIATAVSYLVYVGGKAAAVAAMI